MTPLPPCRRSRRGPHGFRNQSRSLGPRAKHRRSQRGSQHRRRRVDYGTCSPGALSSHCRIERKALRIRVLRVEPMARWSPRVHRALDVDLDQLNEHQRVLSRPSTRTTWLPSSPYSKHSRIDIASPACTNSRVRSIHEYSTTRSGAS